MTKLCINCQQHFIISSWELDFYQRLQLPKPQWCWSCRLRARLAWRNERTLYHRTCDLCQQPMISLYPSGTTFPVYCPTCWWSDRWDSLDYARDYNPNQPFFQQFAELYQRVPKLGLVVSHGENSDYCTYSVYYKNCYMCVSGVVGENNLYCYFMNDARDCVDSGVGFNCEQLYECLDSHNLYNSQFCVDCENSADLFMCTDLISCSNCIGSVGLRHKQYYVFNRPVTPAEYERALQKVKLNWASINQTRLEHIALLRKTPRIYRQARSADNCSGDHIYNSTNTHWAFDVINIENGAYLWNIPKGGREVVDLNYSPNCEQTYNSLSAVNVQQGLSLVTCWDVHFAHYSSECFYSSNLFGAVGIRHGKNVILNRQYDDGQFLALRKRLIEHLRDTKEWGNFFPASLSPFPYNDTVAQERFPLTAKQRVEHQFDYKPAPFRFPQDINVVSDSIVNETLACERCGKHFRFILQELKFYRYHQLPIPTWCPACRYQERMARRNPTQLWNRTCLCLQDNHNHEGNCSVPIKTTFAPDRQMLVYCDFCYQKEMY